MKLKQKIGIVNKSWGQEAAILHKLSGNMSPRRGHFMAIKEKSIPSRENSKPKGRNVQVGWYGGGESRRQSPRYTKKLYCIDENGRFTEPILKVELTYLLKEDWMKNMRERGETDKDDSYIFDFNNQNFKIAPH